jgi:formylglycine-generating enzyme required for sulfatase activity
MSNSQRTQIQVAWIGAIAVIAVAVIGGVFALWKDSTVALIPIQATQTAETKLTQVVLRTQAPSTATLVPTKIVTIVPVPSTPTSISPNAPMIFVPAGEFSMGNNGGDSDEKPLHSVYLDAFWIDKYEVTNTQYAACFNAGVCKAPSNYSSSPARNAYFGVPQFNNYPVVYVSWEDANKYCTWAGRRLPTEAEWEKAARGTDKRLYPWGNTYDKSLVNGFDGAKSDTTIVGGYPGGASPYGVLDMAGNVWEWVADWYDDNYYSNSPRNNPQGPTSGNSRVARGGSWGSGYYQLRTTLRSGYLASTDRSNNYGFRCAK